MWLVDVQAATALEHFDPAFPVSIFSSSADIRFVLGFLFSFPGEIFLVNYPPGFDVVPSGWGTVSIPRPRVGFRT